MLRMRTVAAGCAIVALGGGTAAFAGTGDPGEDRARGDGREGGERGDHRRHDGRHDRDGRHPQAKRHRVATATLIGADGERLGRVWLRRHRGAVGVVAHVRGLAPGFHGFHVHTTGACDPETGFQSAGGHLNLDGSSHGDHAGDLPSLLVTAAGKATLMTVTDRFSLADLRDEDGSAVMVHSDRDNFAHIPSRYGTPDETTRNTGDAGSRVACGVVR